MTNIVQAYFNIKFEFNHQVLREKIEKTIYSKKKGYVCVVDANVLTIAQKNKKYCSVLNDAMVNTCDGSSIAFFAGIIHQKKLRAYSGPEIFQYYIESHYKQILLGNTRDTFEEIKNKLVQKGKSVHNLHYLSLPFANIDEFDYSTIAQQINELKPDIIWVSLGAPKQEMFMNNILPLITQGVMLGIGAAFNFYTGRIKASNFSLFGLRIIWLNRIISEPQKLVGRVTAYLLILPKILRQEFLVRRKEC